MIPNVSSTSQRVFTDIEASERLPANGPRLTREMGIVTYSTGVSATVHLKYSGRIESTVHLEGFGDIGRMRCEARPKAFLQVLITSNILIVLKCLMVPWVCDPEVAGLLIFGDCPFFLPVEGIRDRFTSRYPVESMRALAALTPDVIVSESKDSIFGDSI